MKKLPFTILGSEAWTDQEFDSEKSLFEKCRETLYTLTNMMHGKNLRVGKFFIFRTQIVALPHPEFDQRQVCVANLPDFKFEMDQPRV